MLDCQKEYQIKSFTIANTNSNSIMAKMQLMLLGTDEVFNCVIWKETLSAIPPEHLRIGNVIQVQASEPNQQYNNYVIYKVKLVKEAKLGLSKEEHDVLFNDILEVIQSFTDEKLKNSMLSFIIENQELFKVSPAAINIHHNYIGALMQHIWECIQIAKANFPVVFKEVNHELVLAGCITHDLGKMFEYIVDLETGMITKNKDFQKIWINHIQCGFGWANQNGFPELAHIIASHHGTREWNALVEPLTHEANLVHQIDMISSRLGRREITDLQKAII